MALILLLLAPAVGAEIVEFAWMGGTDVPCTEQIEPRCKGNYSGSAAWPGARCCAHVWSWDASPSAQFLFGGWGYDAAGKLGYLNDLWLFNKTEGTWEFKGGSQYADQPSQTNQSAAWPGARHYGAYAHDHRGSAVYIFGGQGVPNDALLDDLWRLDLMSHEWQFLGKSSALPPQQAPEARKWSSFWAGKDALYVNGGESGSHDHHHHYPGSLNDFWAFSYTTRKWRLIYNRSDDLYGHYDKGEVQWPGARHNAFTTTAADGALWMFGGSGYGKTERGVVSDVWRWDGDAWAFVGGNPGGVEQPGPCSPRGKPQAGALPTARHAGFNFDEPGPTGRMLIFGGEHEAETRVFNDLWSLALTPDGEWAYEAGTCNVANVTDAMHLSKGEAALGNAPAASFSGVGWSDLTTKATWIFGGGPQSGYVSSLWRVRW